MAGTGGGDAPGPLFFPMKKPVKNDAENAELVLFSNPASLLNTVREGNAGNVPTRQLCVFYAMADSVEKLVKGLKEKSKPVIVERRNQGTPTGDKLQHREFRYATPQGEALLQIQERIVQKPDMAKLEALLKAKNLYQLALTTAIDMSKIDGLSEVGLITPEELASVSGEPKPVYALIAQIKPPVT